MIAYLIEVSICWLLFYGIYVLLLSKETFFNINRWYLLSTLIVGLLIPIFTVDITSFFFEKPADGVVYLSNSFSDFELVLESEVAAAQQVEFSWLTILKIAYGIGVFIAFFRFLYGLQQIHQLYREGKVVQKGKYKLVLTQRPHLPFSFFNYLFWHESMELEETDSGKIITHEIAHINQWHSLDVLFLEFLGIFLWFSPPIYWYKKSLRAVHEFLADAYVLRDTKKKQYGHLLIRQVQSGMQIALANNFIHSQLKKRINMMTRNKSRRKALMRYLPALPLLLLMVLVFTNKNVKQNLKETSVKASLAFEEVWEGDFDPKKAKEEMRLAYKDGSKGVFTESGEALNWDAQKMKELHRTCKKWINKFPDKESGIRLLMMEVAAENGYKIRFIGENMSYREIEGFKKGEEIKMEVDAENLPSQSIIPDEPPVFPGGKKEMLQFIYTNVKYPLKAREKGIYGTTIAQFVVEKDGTISNPKIIGNLGGGIEDEVLRIIKLMQTIPRKWTPAKVNGEAVSMTYELPFNYLLEGKGPNGKLYQNNNEPTKRKGITVVGYYAEKSNQKDDLTKANQQIFKNVEEMPRFPGCEENKGTAEERKECAQKKMLEFIYTNIKYPKSAKEQGIQGTVVAKFVVNQLGEITDVEIARSIGGGTDSEVLSTIGKMPNWIPGKKDGKTVNVEFFLPVKFKLAEEDKTAEKEGLELGFEKGIKPLFIVNGKEYTGDFKEIDPNSIATIDVLKDETGEYGEKGKNGVVKIQLKKDKRKGVMVGDFKDKVILKDGAIYTGNDDEISKNSLPEMLIIRKQDVTSDEKTVEGEPVFKVVEEMPLFPGCEGETYSEEMRNCANKKMLEFIYTNIKYPKQAHKEGIEGTVVIRFLVEKDGTISDTEILRNVGGGTGEEALRVVNLMNELDIKWIPGRQRGKTVNVNFNLPVKFKLADKAETDESKKDESSTEKSAPNLPMGNPDEAVTFNLNKNTIKLNAFPNPASEKLTVTMEGQAKNILLTVFDINGKQYIKDEIGAFEGLYYKTLDLQNVAKGTLIINVRHKGKDYQKKVIVQ